VLVSKPSICGAGLNMQHCAREAFVGLGHSWELYYQAIRRVYRFGQKRPVEVKIITSEAEGRVLETIRRKQADADAMAAGMVEHMRDAMLGEIGAADRTKDDYRPTKEMVIPRWLLTA
jgi:N-acetylneuraminic acid mutarotase